MRKVLFALVATALFLQGCEGPVGPPGRDGLNGEDGLIGEVFEVSGVNFTAGNSYRVFYDFDPAIYESDKVIGFIHEGEDNLGDDIWEPLPQTFFNGGNTFVYTLDFTRTGFSFFLAGNSNLANVPVAARTNRIFRVVVIPAAFVRTVNTNSFKDVSAKLGLSDKDVVKITPQIEM